LKQEKHMKKLTFSLAILLTVLLASCSIDNARTMTEGGQTSTPTINTPSNGGATTFPNRSEEWKSQPPIAIEYLEGDEGNFPVRIFYGSVNNVETYGIGIFAEDVYAVDLSNTFITFNETRHPVTNGVDSGCVISADNMIIKPASWKWIINSDKPYINEIKAYNQTTGKYIPAYDIVLEITIIPVKGGDPEFYKVHAYPDGWSVEEFPIEKWYQWAEETFGSSK
jgi:hypothetical protein